MIRLALILCLGVITYGRHTSRKEDAEFQDAVESIARQSIQKIFNNQGNLDEELDTKTPISTEHHLHEGKKKKHRAKSAARHVHKEEPPQAYSNEDQSLYEGNLYQDLYRHLPILPMVPVPLFYEGEDYSGDEPEIASGDDLPSDVRLESNINEDDDDEEQSPPLLANQVPPQPFNLAEIKSFVKKKKSHKKKHHHKKAHLSSLVAPSQSKKPASSSHSSQPKLAVTSVLKKLNKAALFSEKGVKGSVSSHGLKSGPNKVLKHYAQAPSIGGGQKLYSTNKLPAATNPNILGGAQTGQTLGQAGQTLGHAGQTLGQAGQTLGQAGQTLGQAGQTLGQAGDLPSYGNSLGTNSLQSQNPMLQSNLNPLTSLSQNNQLQGNYLGSNSMGGLGNMPSQYGGAQQDLAASSPLTGTQPNNFLSSQNLNGMAPKGGSEGLCPGSCPPACYPKCSDICCNSDYSALSSLLQSSCSPSCAPSYSPQCCSSFSQLQSAAAAIAGSPTPQQLPSQCSQSCSPQYSSSCCGGAASAPQPMAQGLPSLQMPISAPQSPCSPSCAPDFAASCCGSQSPMQMPAPASAPAQQSMCSSACAPQYLQSCCNGALPPSQSMMASQCPSSCAPSYLPSCCTGASSPALSSPPAPAAGGPQGCAPSCAPQYSPSCCSNGMGYGSFPMGMSAPPPPPAPVQIRVGFRAYSMQQKDPCPQSCYSQCASSCPSQCCGMTKRSSLLPAPTKVLKVVASQAKVPVVGPPSAKQLVMKQPAVKPLSPRQMPHKGVPLKPVQAKVNMPGHPLNWDRK